METRTKPVATILYVGREPEFVRDVASALEIDSVEIAVESAGTIADGRENLDGELFGGVVVDASDTTEEWPTFVETVTENRGIPTLVLAADGEQRARAAAAGATDVLVRHGGDADATLLGRGLEYFAERTGVERELEEQSSLLDHIFNQVPSALYVKDENGRHLRKRNFEGDTEEFSGKTDLEIYDGEFGEETFADDMRVIEEGERIINKEEYNPSSGQWTITSKVPWRDESGDIQGLIGVSRLITEKKRYEEKLSLRNRAMEEAPIGIVIYDVADDGRSIRYANRGFEDLTGYDREAIEGGTLHLFEGPETDGHQMSAIDTAFADGEPGSIVTVLYRRDRTPFWARVDVSPVTDDEGQATHYVGFVQDVTETKEHEQTIERRLDEFGNLLAKQLRPPLGEAAAALESVSADEEPAALEFEDLETVERSIQRVDKLVEELADVNTFAVRSEGVTHALSQQSDGERP